MFCLLRIFLYYLCLVLDISVSCVKADVGFNLLFTSDVKEFTDVPIKFNKDLPPWLRGIYIRNAPARFEMGRRNFTHAFDGYGKLISFKFLPEQKVLFSSKFLQTNFYKRSLKTNDIAPYLMLESVQPGFNFIEKISSLYNGIDNVNVNVLKFKTDFVALSDFYQIYEFDPSDLTTVGLVMPALPGGSFYNKYFPLPSASHPVQEYNNSDSHISFVSLLSLMPGTSSYINVVRILSAEKRQLIARIERSQIPYMHCLGLTHRFALIFAHPLYINVLKMLETVEPIKSLDWEPDKPTTVYVVNLQTGSILQFQVKSLFVQHLVNSFEINNQIIADMITYPDVEFMKALHLDVLRDAKKRNSIPVNPSIKRFTINLISMTITVEDLPVTQGREGFNRFDFPVINENLRLKAYCVVYGVMIKADEENLSNVTLVRKNVCNPSGDRMWHRANHYPLEPWFIPYPGSSRETDGILLSLVLDGEKERSYLGIFDPQTLELVNYAYLPTPIAFTLHGRFFPEDLLNNKQIKSSNKI